MKTDPTPFQIDPATLISQLKKGTKPGFEPEKEAAHVLQLLEDSGIKALLGNYKYDHFIASGGSGLVFAIEDTISNTKRALKLSRYGAVSAEKKANDPVDVELEIEALSLVNHQNVTRFYGGALTKDKHYALITHLVENPLNILEWVQSTIPIPSPHVHTDAKSGPPPPQRPSPQWDTDTIHNVFIKLAHILHGYASALYYMHKCELYHMDVKPNNLLVAKDGTPYVTDLGFARCKTRYLPDKNIPVGFTFGFQHPDIGEKYRLLVPESLNRSWTSIPVGDLNARFDLYSFGRTILQLLKLFEKRFGERVNAQYGYSYLHLLATLLLDARNIPIPTEAFAIEISQGIDNSLMSTFKFTSFESVVDRLERFIGKRPIEYRIPELNRWHPKALNHGVGTLVVTSRISNIIQHPAFRRLQSVSQLGTVVEVYPGATHTRHAHSLGVAGTVCECLCALYNDPENPIFNALVEDSDIKAMIVAALLHDLGQSEFGHELEEIDGTSYGHVLVAKIILYSAEYKDPNGYTLKQLIVRDWNIDWESIRAILRLGKGAPTPRFLAFQHFLDSPIDADKIDYLRRDAENCNVPYSRNLDIYRFLKCITVLPTTIGDARFLSLGIKEKGLASSTAITLARYQMYQSVYLHHTSRCLKAMVMTSCAQAHRSLRKEIDSIFGVFGDDASAMIADMFASHLIEQTPKFSVRTEVSGKTVQKRLSRIWKIILDGHHEMHASKLPLDRSISFFMAL